MRARTGGVAVLATRALVVTALVGGTGAYLHADVATSADTPRQGAERVSAAALHEHATAATTTALPESALPQTAVTTAPSLTGEPGAPSLTTTVTTRPATLVHVFHDGCSTPVMTSARTVSGVLTQAKVTVGEHDIVRPGRSTSPKAGMGIHVVRVVIRTVHQQVSVAYRTVRKADAHLTRGHSKVVRQGRHGAARLTYKVVMHDGKVFSRTVTHTATLRAPVSEIVDYGTKKPQAASRAKRSVTSLNWHALAICESDDNPHAVGGHGQFFGLYQFTVGTWHSVGGSGNPADASRAEQTKRAQILYGRRGSAPWPICGAKLYT